MCTASLPLNSLSLHDALPISSLLLPHLPRRLDVGLDVVPVIAVAAPASERAAAGRRDSGLYLSAVLVRCPDRKSTRLNSSHLVISYAVFCLKKKKTIT